MELEKLISIILPVYNGEKYVEGAIKSLTLQTYKAIEIIIIDDCSTDNTQDILQKIEKTDSRIRVYRNDVNKKLPASLNIGHKLAKGEFITWTSDDNILKPNALENYVKYINLYESDIVYFDFEKINDSGEIIGYQKLNEPEFLFLGNYVGASFIYKKNVFDTLNGYNENFFLVEDYDFWLRSLLHFKLKYVSQSFYYYRIHHDSLTAQINMSDEKKNLWIKNVNLMYKNFFDFFNDDNPALVQVSANKLIHHDVDILLLNFFKVEINRFLNKAEGVININSKLILKNYKSFFIESLLNKKKITPINILKIIRVFYNVLEINDLKKLVKYYIKR